MSPDAGGTWAADGGGVRDVGQPKSLIGHEDKLQPFSSQFARIQAAYGPLTAAECVMLDAWDMPR